MSQKVTLQVIGSQTMNCSGCERSAEFSLAMVVGVQQAKANHHMQLITVTYEPDQVTVVKIQATLEEIGYITTPVAS